MIQVAVSSKYQVAIPNEIRRQVLLRKGQKLLMVVKGSAIILVPNRRLASFRGFLKDMKATAIREKRDRL